MNSKGFSAICVQVIELGRCPNEKYGGDSIPRIRLTWELHGDELEGNTRLISKTFISTFGAKSYFRRFVEGWLGDHLNDADAKAFDPETLLGKASFLTVEAITGSQGHPYYVPTQAEPLKGDEPIRRGGLTFFAIRPWNQEAYDRLPAVAKRELQKSDEYAAIMKAQSERRMDAIVNSGRRGSRGRSRW